MGSNLPYTCYETTIIKSRSINSAAVPGGKDYGMKVVTKFKCAELEVINIYIEKGITIRVEIFVVPDGYKSFATDPLQFHDSLTGAGFHKDKKESVKLAIDDLRELMGTVKG